MNKAIITSKPKTEEDAILGVIKEHDLASFMPNPLQKREDYDSQNNLLMVTPFSMFNILSANNGLSELQTVEDVYVRRNLLMTMWSNRVEYLFNQISSSLRSTLRDVSDTYAGDTYVDVNFLKNMLTFEKIVSENTANDLALQLTIPLFNRINNIIISDTQIKSMCPDEYAGKLAQATAALGDFNTDVVRVLAVLKEELEAYYIPVFGLEHDPEIAPIQNVFNLRQPITKLGRRFIDPCESCDAF